MSYYSYIVEWEITCDVARNLIFAEIRFRLQELMQEQGKSSTITVSFNLEINAYVERYLEYFCKSVRIRYDLYYAIICYNYI